MDETTVPSDTQVSLLSNFLLQSPPSLLSPPAIVSEEWLSCGSQSSIPGPPYVMDRARVLLEFGVRPLVPPARRNWSGVTPFPIMYNGVCLTWPPACWESMTPDQKLQSWEFAAILLETGGVVSAMSLSSSRSFLLTRYNLLCLPG